MLQKSGRYWGIVGVCVALASTSVLAQDASPADDIGGSQAVSSEGHTLASDSSVATTPPTIQGTLQRIAGALEAANNKRESDDDADHTRRDLAAQEDMAFWAKLMFWAASAETIVTGIGVWLVLRTLIHTRRAANYTKDAVDEAKNQTAETRRIGEAQVRAYVSWSGVRPGVSFNVEDAPVAIRLTAHIRNTGQSPSTLRALYVDCPVVAVGEMPTVTFSLEDARTNHELGAGAEFSFLDQYIPIAAASASRAKSAVCYIVAWCAYRDVFQALGEPDRVVSFCFEVDFDTEPAGLTRDLIVNPNFSWIGFRSTSNYQVGPA
jgi:hypothetical protein